MPGLSKAARHRWSVASRVIAGTMGAYGLTSLVTIALSLVLALTGMGRVEAVTAATLASFAIFAMIAMAAFHISGAIRIWLWLITLSVLVGLVILTLLPEAKG